MNAARVMSTPHEGLRLSGGGTSAAVIYTAWRAVAHFSYRNRAKLNHSQDQTMRPQTRTYSKSYLTAVTCGVMLAIGCAADPPPPVLAAGFDQLDLVVLNQGGQTWTTPTFTLNPGGYTITVADVKGGGRARVPAVDLADATGQRFDPYRIKPASLTLTTTIDGQTVTHVYPFTPR